MKDHQQDSALGNARRRLRTKQREYASAALRKGTTSIVTDASLRFLDHMTQFQSTDMPNLVRRGAFKFERELEIDRIARAKSLIRRVEPGRYEDPTYLAFLAYQAASIEMAYEHMATESADRTRFSRFLLGTVYGPEVNAFAHRLSADGYTIVVLHSGLVDFIYQAAKAIVEALNPSRTEHRRSAVSAVYDLEGIRSRLASNPGPAERLYRTLEAYFFNGYPRASAFETIPEKHGPPLSLIVGMAERWIIAHEYGHGFAPSFAKTPAGVNASKAEEYFSDATATVSTVFSAAKLDAVPPEFPLGGAIFALACLDLLNRTINTLRNGHEQNCGAESTTHPPARERAGEVINCFRQYFDVDYFPNGLFDLRFVIRSEPPKSHNFSAEHSKRAYAYANVLQTLWEPVKERLHHDYSCDRPLHSYWR